MEIAYVTSNAAKFQIATSVLKENAINLIQRNIEVPEIQSMNVQEIAEFSGLWARDKLNCSVVVTDVGLYIDALNGFPDPFVKYAKKWVTVEDVLELLEDKQDRTVHIKEALAFCKTGCEPMIFSRQIKGVITHKIFSNNGSLMDQLVIPENDILLSEIPEDQYIDFWIRHSVFNDFKDCIMVPI